MLDNLVDLLLDIGICIVGFSFTLLIVDVLLLITSS